MKAWILEKQVLIENSPLELKEVPQPEPGDKLGLYGFGPTANYVLQVAKYETI